MRQIQGWSVVKCAAPIPRPVPTLRFDRLAHGSRMKSPSHSARWITAIGKRRHHVDRGDHQPAKPDAGARPALADAVHPVIPVAGTDQRHPVFTRQVNGLIQPTRTVFKQAGTRLRYGRLKEIVVRTGRDRWPLQKRQFLIQNALIAGYGNIAGHAIAKPDAVVRNAGADPLPGMRQPPVLHVAFGELATGGAQQMRPRHFGPTKGQGHAILQLIAKSVGAARLIKPGTGPDPAGQCLIQQPAVQHDIHRPVGRGDLHRGQQVGPMTLHRLQGLVKVCIPHPLDQRAGSCFAVCLTDLKNDLDHSARLQGHPALQGSAGIECGARATRKRPAR